MERRWLSFSFGSRKRIPTEFCIHARPCEGGGRRRHRGYIGNGKTAQILAFFKLQPLNEERPRFDKGKKQRPARSRAFPRSAPLFPDSLGKFCRDVRTGCIVFTFLRDLRERVVPICQSDSIVPRFVEALFNLRNTDSSGRVVTSNVVLSPGTGFSRLEPPLSHWR